MVNKKMYQRIQELKKKGFTKTSISEKLQIDPTTVRKYFEMKPSEYGRYLESVSFRQKKYEDYESEILELYRKNNNQRLNMTAVYDYLEEKYIKLPGGEKTLRNYIHYLEKSGILKYENRIRCYKKVPELPYGKQMQIDFGEYKTKSGLHLYIFGAVLSSSRYKYISFQSKPFTTIDLIFHMLDCFDYFGGIPQQLVIDQDCVMVVNENYGDIIYTQKFKMFITEMDINMYVCRKADPESKGKIENLIKYVKYNFLQVRDFNNLEDAKDSLRKWLIRRANGKISQATKKVPSLAIIEERFYLRTIRNSIFRKDTRINREERTVSDKSYIMVDSTEYSVPTEYRNMKVEIFKTDSELYIFDEKIGKEIAKHSTMLLPGKKSIIREHFRSKTKSLKEIHSETIAMHSFQSWKDFVKQNIKLFSRYSRDQCLLAHKYFKEIKEQGLFEEAIFYCQENKTYSMKDLLDTYNHLLKEHKEMNEAIIGAFSGITKAPKYTQLDVPKRQLKTYENIIGGRK